MRGDEREEYGEEARDVIEGLRRLAHRSETPPDLRSAILAQGERLLPPQKRRLARWWTVIGAWRPHPSGMGTGRRRGVLHRRSANPLAACRCIAARHGV